VLARAVNAHKVSQSGTKAFLAAVDPFHDKPISGIEGWPDMETAQSVVRHWKQSLTISSPDEGGGIIIYMWPVLNSFLVDSSSRTNNYIQTPAGLGSFLVGGVSVHRYSGVELTNFPLNAPEGLMSIPADYFSAGPNRLIGWGVEVRDVTAEIYKQGTLTICEVPQTTADVELVNVHDGGVFNGCVNMMRLQKFPDTLSDAMTFSNSLQWEAKEGCYVVAPFQGHENPSKYCEYTAPIINKEAETNCDVPGADNVEAIWAPVFQSFTLNKNRGAKTTLDPLVYATPNFVAPINSKAVYLTGLNANSTFTVTVSWYFETFPNNNSDLQPLAAPSAPFDPKALAMISSTMANLPVGCRISENPLGEWFFEALEAAIPAIGTVASVAFPEFSPFILPAQKIASAAVSKKITEDRARAQRKAALKNEVKKDVKSELSRLSKKK